MSSEDRTVPAHKQKSMTFLLLNSARRWGGTEKWLRMAAEGLAANGHRVLLAYRSEAIGGRFDPRILRLKLPFVFEFDLYTIGRIYLWTRRHRVEVMIPTKPKEYFIAGVLSRLLGAVNILRLGIVREVHHRWWQRLVYNRLADGIIVNAAAIAETLTRCSNLPSEKVRLVYNGFDTAEPVALTGEQQARQEQILAQMADYPFVIGYLGELSARKGIEQMLRFFADLTKTADAGFALCLLGDGDLRAKIVATAEELGIRDRLIMPGFVEEPRRLLAACKVFVLLSQNEGIANAMLEAMYCELPVLITRAGGAAEVIRDGENGFLLDRADSTAFVALVTSLKNNEAWRQKIGKAAKATVVQQFSLAQMVTGMEDFILGRQRQKKREDMFDGRK